jgi:hypothetical protein
MHLDIIGFPSFTIVSRADSLNIFINMFTFHLSFHTMAVSLPFPVVVRSPVFGFGDNICLSLPTPVVEFQKRSV